MSMFLKEDKMKFYKTVLMPIQVPHGDFCFGEGRCCEHLDTEGGHALCTLSFSPDYNRKSGTITKPKECKELEGESNG